MKSLLAYFVEFYENSIIVSKEYPDDCTVGRPNQKPIIIIIFDESIFFANNRYKKVWTLNSQDILQPKKKKKRNHGIKFLTSIIKAQPVILIPSTTRIFS